MPKSNEPKKEVSARLLASAKMGVSESMMRVAEIYKENQEFKEAIFWFSEVVKALGTKRTERWKLAVNKLGSIAFEQKNLIQARQFFEKAASEGFWPAQFNAGLVAQRENRLQDALGWFEAAAKSGHPGAIAKVEELKKVVHTSKTTPRSEPSKPPHQVRPKPKDRLIRKWDDAELVALEWMIYFGFTDAKKTKGGSDEGVDLRSIKAVAQVKFQGAHTPRTDIQLLHSAMTREKKLGIFFSLGYRRTAIDFANSQEIALFEFDLQGTPTPINASAREIDRGI
jgi:tetratricopeptide (TPR) repeat protein